MGITQVQARKQQAVAEMARLAVHALEIDEATLALKQKYFIQGDYPAIAKLANKIAALDGQTTTYDRYTVRHAIKGKLAPPALANAIKAYYQAKDEFANRVPTIDEA